MRKVGRNDPCPCGSGKKYKKCCMAKDEVQRTEALPEDGNSELSSKSDKDIGSQQPSARLAEIENNFRRACNYLDRNDFERAARIFRSVILLDPSHYKALTGLGRCLIEMGMREEAFKCFEKALEINPNYTQAQMSLKLYGNRSM